MISNAREIINNAEILTIVQNRTPVKPAGGGRYKANCPVHGGTGWSLSVQPDQNTWFCFSACYIGGGPLEFLCAVEKMDKRDDFAEAVEMLARETGQVCRYDERRQKETSVTREDLFAAVRAAAEHYRGELYKKCAAHALDYARQRGLNDDIIKRWGIGYARGNSVAECGADPDHLVEAGVLKRPKVSGEKLYDPLAGRLIIPLHNPAGRPVGFTARLIPQEKPDGGGNSGRPSYINTSETAIFKKGNNLFGFCNAKQMKPDKIYIMEGQLKVIAAQEAGFAAAAPGGTALTERQAALAARLSHNIHLTADNDQAGRKSAMNALYIFRHMELIPEIAALDKSDPEVAKLAKNGKLDPDDLLAAGLPIKFKSRPWTEWILQALNIHPSQEPEPVEAAQIIHKFILPILNEHPAPAVRAAERSRLASLTNLPEHSIQRPAAPGAGKKAAAAKPNRREKTPPSGTAVDSVATTKMTPGRLLAAALLQADTEPDGRGPLWWREYIDFLHIPKDLIGVIQEIAHVRRIMNWRELTLAEAIAVAAPAGWRPTFNYWAAVELPGPPDEQLIAQLNTTIRKQFLQEQTVAAKAEIQKESSPVQRLSNIIQEKSFYEKQPSAQ